MALTNSDLALNTLPIFQLVISLDILIALNCVQEPLFQCSRLSLWISTCFKNVCSEYMPETDAFVYLDYLEVYHSNFRALYRVKYVAEYLIPCKQKGIA